MDNKNKGKYGEDAAVHYLEKSGIEILERNYRHGRGEIDIISLEQNTLLIFVEVKLRSTQNYGTPEEFVSSAQQQIIKETAEEYIFGINWQKDIRFDIITVTSEGEIEHFEDAFY